MTDETWAIGTVRVYCDRSEALIISEELDSKPSRISDHGWSLDFRSDDSRPLDSILTLIRDFLRANRVVLQKIAEDFHLNLSLSWTPRNPQDGIILDVDLIGLLGALRMNVNLDTYID